MAKTTCDICNAFRALPCKKCGTKVCRIHREHYFDEEFQKFVLLCHNCGRALASHRSPTTYYYRKKRYGIKKYKYI